ncbi:MAG: hypothetical protein BWX80_03537 [Candidatus Hydrogenedentes bacterium ADurb.Bin101]|nr:MAG: hypothetical protein BWX80_03537 [Candidatus Hydrogenedentes bacterium ADurb.Bin101]
MLIKARVSYEPWPPTPMEAMTIRLLGATVPSRPSAEAGMMAGNTAAAAALFKKVRRDKVTG